MSKYDCTRIKLDGFMVRPPLTECFRLVAYVYKQEYMCMRIYIYIYTCVIFRIM